jgi:O-antigen/teichoic acid export membrane protein
VALVLAAAGAASVLWLLPSVTILAIAWTLTIFMGSATLSTLQNVQRATFNRIAFSVAAIALPVLQVGFLVVLVPHSSDPMTRALAAMAVAYVTVALGQGAWLIYASRRMHVANHSPNPGQGDLLRRGLAYGLPLTLAMLSVNLLQSGDRFILAPIVTLDALGVYAFWMALGNQAGRAITGMIFPIINPRLFQLWGLHPRRAVRYSLLAAFAYVACGIPLLVGIGFGLPYVVQFAGVRNVYLLDSSVLWFGLTSAFLWGLIQIVGKICEFLNRTYVLLAANVVGLGATVILVLNLVPKLGVYGAAFGAVGGALAALLIVATTTAVFASRYQLNRGLWQ